MKEIFQTYKKTSLLISFLTLLLVIYGYIYTMLPKEEEKLKNALVRYTSVDSVEIINSYIASKLKGQNIDRLFTDKNFRKEVKQRIKLFINDRIKYIFIIYKDKDGRFKYLLDPSSSKDNKGLLFIPFPEEKPILKEVINKRKVVYIIHKYTDTIGITYYIPLIKNGKVKAILVIDFSFQVLQEIDNLVNLVKNVILGFIGITVFLILVSIFVVIKSIFTSRKLYIDQLTQVYNRNYLKDLEHHFNLNDYFVVMADIDFFKQINDTYGHKVGDEILKEFAQLLKKNLRSEDKIIRYGGEEFLILLKRDRKQKEKTPVINVLKRLLNEIRQHKFSNNLRITASFGINLDTDKARNLIDAIKKADEALYKAKQTGRNKIEFFTENQNEGEISISQLNELIEKREITFVFQPIVKLKTQKTEYYESLLRFKYKGKLIPPFKYLEMIKGSFLYSKLSKVVVEENIKLLSMYPKLKISINLSPHDLLNESIIYILIKAPEHIISRMKIEIIETEDVKDLGKLKENVEKLKEHGYTIVLDDFGRGYINFYYLTELGAAIVKVDGSVIKQITKNKLYYTLTKYIKAFANELGMKVVAEFVEDENIYKTLLELGIEYGQGYYFSPPKPLEDILKEIGEDNES